MRKNVSVLNNMSRAVRRLLWKKSAVIEKYEQDRLIYNGKNSNDIDFLYVLKGSIVYKLESRESKTFTKNLYLEFQKDEFIDWRTITAKRIKTLKNMNFDKAVIDKDSCIKEESFD